MGSTLNWKPLEEYKGSLPRELRNALQRRSPNGLADGKYDHSDLDFLDGLRICGIKGAEVLIGLIHEHDAVYLEEIF